MKHLLLSALLLAAAKPVLAQATGVSVPSYTTKSGAVYRAGDVVHLVAGTMPDGRFKYVYIPANVWLGFPVQQLGTKWNRRHPSIKHILRQQTAPDTAYHAVAILNTNGLDACVDLEEAEAVGEIQRPTGSVADELLKLKKLLEAGALTQAEFDAQKAKLLGQ